MRSWPRSVPAINRSARGAAPGTGALIGVLSWAWLCPAAEAGTVHFDEPSIANIAEFFFVAPSSTSSGRFELIQWPPNPKAAAGDSAVGWDVGRFTGLDPSPPLGAHQRGVSKTIVGSTAVQAAGGSVGILIDSASLTTPDTVSGTLLPIVAQYLFPEPAIFRPFAQAGQLLVFAMQAQIPRADGEGTCGLAASACAYATMYFDLEDRSTGLGFWYGATLYDTRGSPNGIGHLGESVMYDGSTKQAIIGGVVNLGAAEGARFTTALATSNGFQTHPWTGYLAFQFALSATNLENAVAAIKAEYPAQYQDLSANPADYRVLNFNLNPEAAYFGGRSHIGMSFNNLRISVQDASDCYHVYNGVNDVPGLTNGDARFLCHEAQWYDCGYPDAVSWSVHASDGQRVGDHVCRLRDAQWIGT